MTGAVLLAVIRLDFADTVPPHRALGVHRHQPHTQQTACEHNGVSQVKVSGFENKGHAFT
jgi:hypothetical protein